MMQIPRNYEELTWKLLDIVVDSYKNVSIKTEECESRGCSDKVIINRLSPRYQNIFKFFCEMALSGEDACILQTSIIYFSKEDCRVRVNASQVTNVDEYLSNQEEADTKVILHSAHAMNTTEGLIILWSPSGVTGIIIAISHKPH